MRNFVLLISCCLSLLIGPTSLMGTGVEPIAVIVNKSNPTDNIQSKRLSRIYRGRLNKWSSGQKIVVINRPFDSEIRVLFYRKVLGTIPTKRFFKPGTPIPFRMMHLRSDLATRKFVARIPNAVGYIYLSEVDDSIKVLRIDGMTPGEKGYRLN